MRATVVGGSGSAAKGEMIVRRNSILLLFVISLVFAASECQSDVIYSNDGKIVFGIVESENESHIFFLQRLPAEGSYQQRVFPRDQIRRLLVTVDQHRLAQLQHGEWESYRDWAEELSVQATDPEARDLALRLYLIVARHADEPLRSAGFQGAIKVAGSSAPSNLGIQRRIQALALQEYEGETPWEMNDADSDTAVASSVARKQERLRDVAAEIRRFRLRMANTLGQLSRDDLTRESLEKFRSICTWQRFEELVTRSELDFASTSRLLNLELAILSDVNGKDPPPEPPGRDSPWSVLVNQDRPAVELVSFANVSAFDLNATVFRDGAWKKSQ